MIELRRPKLITEIDAKLNELAYRVIGAAMEVHKTIGPGFSESVYEEALVIELKERGIPFLRQVKIEIGYKDHVVGEGKIDLIVAGELVLELKAVEKLLPLHSAQLLSYLKATGKKLGLLINFNVPVLKDGIERIAN
jgi:GxxExxY protein